MANFNYHPPKEAIRKGFGGYKSGQSMDKIKTDMGLIECQKHLGRYYDPKKYNQCYLCYLEEQKRKCKK